MNKCEYMSTTRAINLAEGPYWSLLDYFGSHSNRKIGMKLIERTKQSPIYKPTYSSPKLEISK